jgi:hypothetical protein
MKRTFVFLFAVSVIVIALMACSNDYSEASREDDMGGDEENVELVQSLTAPSRKIIYEIDASYYVDDIDQALVWLKDLMEEDEWIDREERSNARADLTFRIKSSRLDAFIAAIESEYVMSSYRKVGEDISRNYQNTSDLITRYTNEKTRNLKLIDGASISEILIITERVSELEQMIATLQGELNLFDSLVDYSEVRLSVYEKNVYTRLPFGARINDGFSDGVAFVIDFFDGLVIVLVTLFPIAIVFGPIGYGGYRIVKFVQLKRRKASEKDKKDKE